VKKRNRKKERKDPVGGEEEGTGTLEGHSKPRRSVRLLYHRSKKGNKEGSPEERRGKPH